MYPCIEAIEWSQGRAHRLPYHQRRVEAAFRCLYPGVTAFSLSDELEKRQHLFPVQGTYKLRLEYNEQLQTVEFQEYRLRSISTLKMVETGQPTLDYKSSVRALIDEAFSARGTADDVLLVRDGMLTDTSYANIALYDGTKWKSPRIPLLYGTRRAYLIDRQQIETADIRADELHRFQLIRLFNALIDFGAVELPVKAILR